GIAVDARLVVQVRTGGASGGPDAADDLADADALSFRHVDRGEMAITCRQAVAVIDLNHLAVAAAPSRRHPLAGRGGAHRVAGIGAHVEAGVHGERADERVHAHAEAGAELHLAGERLAYRYRREHAIEMLDLRARQRNAVELALEWAAVAARRHRHERS